MVDFPECRLRICQTDQLTKLAGTQGGSGLMSSRQMRRSNTIQHLGRLVFFPKRLSAVWGSGGVDRRAQESFRDPVAPLGSRSHAVHSENESDLQKNLVNTTFKRTSAEPSVFIAKIDLHQGHHGQIAPWQTSGHLSLQRPPRRAQRASGIHIPQALAR